MLTKLFFFFSPLIAFRKKKILNYIFIDLYGGGNICISSTMGSECIPDQTKRLHDGVCLLGPRQTGSKTNYNRKLTGPHFTERKAKAEKEGVMF